MIRDTLLYIRISGIIPPGVRALRTFACPSLKRDDLLLFMVPVGHHPKTTGVHYYITGTIMQVRAR